MLFEAWKFFTFYYLILWVILALLIRIQMRIRIQQIKLIRIRIHNPKKEKIEREGLCIACWPPRSALPPAGAPSTWKERAASISQDLKAGGVNLVFVPCERDS
jgi:hypothetical protein